MLNNKLSLIILAVVSVLATGCTNKNDKNTVLWGKTDTYDPFLWKKQTPDTLKQTLCFDFNDDAVKYMSAPLKLGIFEKDEDGHLSQVKSSEMELFVNGKPVEGNIICVNASEKEVEVGVVFNTAAEDKIHYWYIKSIDTTGLDRINDRDTYGNDEAVMEIKLQKHHVMNPLAKGLMWLGIIILAALILWFMMLKKMIFPTFRVTRLQLVGPEPYCSQLKIKGYRKCILSASPKKQNWLNRVFTGAIKYETNPIWSAPIELKPRDKKSVRIYPDKTTYMVDARTIKTNIDYLIVNEQTKAKTKMTIS